MTGNTEKGSIGLNWFLAAIETSWRRCFLAGFPTLKKTRRASAFECGELPYRRYQVMGAGFGFSSRPKNAQLEEQLHRNCKQDWEMTSGGVKSMPNTKQPTMM